jgi:hypothetical protein
MTKFSSPSMKELPFLHPTPQTHAPLFQVRRQKESPYEFANSVINLGALNPLGRGQEIYFLPHTSCLLHSCLSL